MTRRIDYAKAPMIVFEFYRLLFELTRSERGFDCIVTSIAQDSDEVLVANQAFSIYSADMLRCDREAIKPSLCQSSILGFGK